MQLQDPAISKAIARHVATGNYRSPDEVVLRAMKTLDEHTSNMAALAASIADEEAGRVRPLAKIADEIRTKHGFTQPS